MAPFDSVDLALKAQEGIGEWAKKCMRRAEAAELQVGQSIAAERERCARLVEDWAKAYPVSMFGNPAHGKHGPTVDSCSAKALRESLPVIAQAIRGDDLDAKLGLCHEVSRWDGGEIYCYKPLPCATHEVKPKDECKHPRFHAIYHDLDRTINRQCWDCGILFRGEVLPDKREGHGGAT